MILKIITQKYLFLFLMLIITGVFMSSCARDKSPVIVNNCEEEITYQKDLQLILDNNCSFSGCHDAGSIVGDFTTFENISSFFNSGIIKQVTIDERSMPLGDTLSTDDLILFECWIQGGYLEL